MRKRIRLDWKMIMIILTLAWPTMLKMYLVGALISSPKIQAKMGSAMTEGMLAPYKKILAQAEKENKGETEAV